MNKTTLEEYIEVCRYMGEKDKSIEELTEEYKLIYETDYSEIEETKTYLSLIDYIKKEYKELTPGIFTSVYEEIELGFAPCDLSHYTIDEIEEKFKKLNQNKEGE